MVSGGLPPAKKARSECGSTVLDAQSEFGPDTQPPPEYNDDGSFAGMPPQDSDSGAGAGPNSAGSAALQLALPGLPNVTPPMLWMVGEGASPNVWWRDCSQPFASVLETQMVEAVPVARYSFYGDLRGQSPLCTIYAT